MQYPSIGDYIEALRSPEDNLSELTHLSLVYDEHSYPVMSSGNFAVVFKMYDDSENKYYALKCFLREQEERADRYKAICEELSKSESPYLVDISYIEDEIFVDVNGAEAGEFPVLLMDWIDGLPLDKYIEQNIDNKYKLEKLAYDFSLLAQWLIAQPFAHGDLKPDNISVLKNGNLVLLDYDGMYTPSMKGSKALESGSPNYRHPDRLSQAFDERIDDYSLSLIHLSLRAIVLEPSLYKQLHSTEYLLISEQEQANIYESRAINSLQALMYDKGFMRAYTLYLSAYVGNLGVGSANLFAVDKPKLEARIISTEVTDEDWIGAYEDEYGVFFNEDGTKLLKATKDLEEYTVPDGVLSICDRAFFLKWKFPYNNDISLKTIEFPNSLTSIGNSAFNRCENLSSIELPDSLTSIGNGAFYGCKNLSSIELPDSLMSIGDGAFGGCENLSSIELPDSLTSIGKHTFSRCKNLSSIELPDSLTSIGYEAFYGCTNLISIEFPDSLTSIGDEAFYVCTNLISIELPDSLTSIGDEAFYGCTNLISIELPDSLTSIGDEAFSGCTNLISIELPDSLTSIGNDAFYGCISLSSIELPDSLTSIGNGVFSRCKKLRSIELPESLTSIGNVAFLECENLSSIEFPDSLESIGNSAFSGCKKLRSIELPESLTSIGNGVFCECENLSSIKLPDSLTSIGNYAFCVCENLSSIKLPNSLTSIGDRAFGKCENLRSIELPDSLTSIGNDAFWECENLTDIRVARGKRAYFEKILDPYLHQYIREYINIRESDILALFSNDIYRE